MKYSIRIYYSCDITYYLGISNEDKDMLFCETLLKNNEDYSSYFDIYSARFYLKIARETYCKGIYVSNIYIEPIYEI